MGNVPVIMDNLLQDGTTEPAIVITTNTAYLGAANQGYPNLRNSAFPSSRATTTSRPPAQNRACAGLSAGASITVGLINYDPPRFGYYGVWSFNAGITPTLRTSAGPTSSSAAARGTS